MISELSDAAGLDEALATGRAVLFKHSPRCWISRRARDEVEAFADRNPEVPVYQVNVLDARGVSDEVASRLGVGHESPQAIMTGGGRAVASTSHFDVTADWLERRLEEATA